MFGEPEGNDCPFDDLGVSGEEEFSLEDTTTNHNCHVAPVAQPPHSGLPEGPVSSSVAPTLPTIDSTIESDAVPPTLNSAPQQQQQLTQTASLMHNPFAGEEDDFTLQSGSFEVSDAASSPPPEEPPVPSTVQAPQVPVAEPPQQVQPLLVSALATRSSSSDATAATSTKSAAKVVPKALEHNPFAAVGDDDPFGSDEQSGGPDFFGGNPTLPETQPAHTLFYEQAPPVLQPSPSYGQSLPPNAFSGTYVPTNAFQTHNGDAMNTQQPPAPPLAPWETPFGQPPQQTVQSQQFSQPQMAQPQQMMVQPQQMMAQPQQMMVQPQQMMAQPQQMQPQQMAQSSSTLPPQIPMFFSPSPNSSGHGNHPSAPPMHLPSTLTPQHILTHRDHAAPQHMSQSPVIPPQLPPLAAQSLPPQAPQFSSTPNTPSMNLATPGPFQQQAPAPTTVSPNFVGQRSSSAVSQHSFSTATPRSDSAVNSPFVQQQQHQPHVSTQSNAQLPSQLPAVPAAASLGPSVYHRQHQRQQSDSAIPHHPEGTSSATTFYQNSAGHMSHRSDSAPLYHQAHHFSHNTPQFAPQHPSAAVMPPRAESQHFYPQSEFQNSNAPRQPFVPQVQHFVPQPVPLSQPQQQQQQTSYQPQQQQQQQWNGGFTPSTPFQGTAPEDEAFMQLFEARKKGCSAVLGFGGRIFMVAGTSVATMTVQGALTATESETTFPTASGRKYAQEIGSLPGCLTPTTKPEVVNTALANCNSLPLLVSLLQVMCSKSMDWAKGGQQEIMRALQEAIRASAGNTSLPVWNPAAPAPWGQQEAFSTIQQLLAAGDRAQAVRCAMHYKLHSHALMIALMCDTKDVYQQVVQAIVQDDLLSSSPLAFAYSAFNELPCPEIAEGQKGALLSQWMEHVEMLVANFTREAGEGLLQWGDRLLEDGQCESAHVCYLIAQLSPAARVNPQQPANPRAQQVVEALRSRYLLLGGQYNRTLCRAALVRPRTVFLTEVLEYSRQRENEKFVRAQLIPFRVMMAEMYCELGLVSQAESYLAHVARLLPSPQPRKDDPSARSVAEVVDVLRKRISLFNHLGSSSQGSGQKSGGAGWWPFGKPQSSTPTAQQQPSGGAKPSATLQASGNISRASSANPIASSRPSSSPPPQQPLQSKPVAAAPTSTKQEPEPTEPQPQKSRWGLGGLFRRSASQQQQQAQQKAKEEKEAKEMIIDTDEPPQFDPATGRWLFKKSAEELAVEQQVKAGPPKLGALPQQQQQQIPLSSFQGPPMMTSAPAPPMGYAPPMGSSGMPPPPPPPGNMAIGTQRRYIDAFNS